VEAKGGEAALAMGPQVRSRVLILAGVLRKKDDIFILTKNVVHKNTPSHGRDWLALRGGIYKLGRT
jgi:hypothetical protein